MIEKIANMGSWLLKPIGAAALLKKLAEEGKSIPSTSKHQKGILQNVELVRGICSMTQLDYFRVPGSLRVTELNASRPFVTGVRSITFFLAKTYLHI